jgi:molecular chaperone DnaK (HSP70)
MVADNKKCGQFEVEGIHIPPLPCGVVTFDIDANGIVNIFV